MTMTDPDLKDGRVVGIAGPVIDVEFPRGALADGCDMLCGLPRSSRESLWQSKSTRRTD